MNGVADARDTNMGAKRLAWHKKLESGFDNCAAGAERLHVVLHQSLSRYIHVCR